MRLNFNRVIRCLLILEVVIDNIFLSSSLSSVIFSWKNITWIRIVLFKRGRKRKYNKIYDVIEREIKTNEKYQKSF